MAHFLHPIEQASRDRLQSLQLKRLRWSVTHAHAGNSHYRARYGELGLCPEDLTTLDDLANFPFTLKSDLREAYPFGFFAVPEARLARLHASSGTTGKPTVVGYTLRDIDTWRQVMARSIHAAGGRRGMKVQVSYGYGLFTGGLGAHYGAEALGCTVIPMSGGQTEKQVQLICDLRPDIIMVTPSYMLALLDEFRRRGLDPRVSSLKIGIFGAEPWSEGMRREIEEGFGIDAVDIYGLSELIGPGIGQECGEAKDGLTIWEDHFYPEIIDPETGRVLPDGEMGELVLTSLTKEAMPIIRYRTRDVTRLLPGTARPMRRLARIAGRTDDMMIIRGVNLFPGQIEEQILACGALASHFVVEISRPERLDHVTLRVEARAGAGSSEREAARDELAHRIKALIGLSIETRIEEPESLPRSTGKACRIVDMRVKTTGGWR